VSKIKGGNCFAFFILFYLFHIYCLWWNKIRSLSLVLLGELRTDVEFWYISQTNFSLNIFLDAVVCSYLLKKRSWHYLQAVTTKWVWPLDRVLQVTCYSSWQQTLVLVQHFCFFNFSLILTFWSKSLFWQSLCTDFCSNCHW